MNFCNNVREILFQYLRDKKKKKKEGGSGKGGGGDENSPISPRLDLRLPLTLIPLTEKLFHRMKITPSP